jgi:HK97 gp10 family phage protein
MSDVQVIWDEAAVKIWADGPAGQAAVDRTAGLLTQAMKRRAPVSPVGRLHRSGQLRSSIHAFRLGDGSVIVGPTADYAQYVLEGTPPHIIRSKGPWPLRNRETGQVFGPVVHHPGTSAQPFVTEALRDVEAMHLTYHEGAA